MTTKLAGTLLVVFSFGSAWAVADPAVPEHRPVVTAILVNGSTIEGVLLEFSQGQYKLWDDGVERTVAETAIRRLAFRLQQKPAEPEEGAGKVTRPKTPHDPEIDKHIQALMRSRYGQNEEAIAKLAAMGPEVVDPLLAAVAKNSDIYQAAAEVFVRMGPDVFPRLVDRARERNSFETIQPLRFALTKMGEDGLPVVVAMVTDPEPRIRAMGFDAVPYAAGAGRKVPQEVFEKLLEGVHDLSPDVQSSVCQALGQCRNAPSLSVPVLRRVLEQCEYDQVRSAAASSLYSAGYYLSQDSPEFHSIVEAFAEALVKDPYDSVRRSCAFSLGQLGQRDATTIPALQKAVPALRIAAKDKIAYVQQTALETLHQLGAAEDVVGQGQDATPEQIATLVTQLSANSATQRAAQRQLQQLGPEYFHDVVKEVRKNPQMQSWQSVSRVFASWGTSMLPNLAELAGDEQMVLMRRIAAHAYGEMPLLEVPEELLALLEDEESWVRLEAIRALAKLANQATNDSWSGNYRRYTEPTVKHTKEQLQGIRDVAVGLLVGELTDLSEASRKEALSALEEVAPGHEKTAPAVIRVLAEDPSSDVRADAAYELRGILSAVRGKPEVFHATAKALVDAVENDEEEGVRRNALVAAACSAPQLPETISMLKTAVKDPALQSSAREFLERIEGQRSGREDPPAETPPPDPFAR
ncbi:MAG TPA: HEAT repeat domain-containing protein [Thermoguttaceae bacterium]|nr:HEAT repeat domain-containing protein [Thermoguttaceae bacterium]